MADRRWTWSARGQGNRIVYSLAAGWLVWLVVQRPALWLIPAVAVVVYVVMSAVIWANR